MPITNSAEVMVLAANAARAEKENAMIAASARDAITLLLSLNMRINLLDLNLTLLVDLS
jgi:hypothetical protein